MTSSASPPIPSPEPASPLVLSASTTTGGLGEGTTGPFLGDAAATICAHLIVKSGFTCTRVAHNLGLPPLVVEECVRNGESSPALRAQLGQWLQENTRVTANVPPFLVRTLHEACAGDEISQRQRARHLSLTTSSPPASLAASVAKVSMDAVDSYDDGSLFNALDPLSREHFTSLRNSVGQSFISILNDPGESTEGAAWGSWLGGKLYEAFDYNGRTVSGAEKLEEALRQLHLRQQQDPESSTSLLQLHPAQTDFSDYVQTVTSAYNANRKESREMRETAFLERNVRPEELPWPLNVPTTFFEPHYDPSTEVASLPTPLPTAENLSALLPTTTTGGAGEDLSALMEARIVGPTTFRRDFDALEERSKELRAWEDEVEKCLLQHVQSRSEDFFHASTEFSRLGVEGEIAVREARDTRLGGITTSNQSLNDLLRIGSLYRRQTNFNVLSAFLGRAITVFQQLQAVDNWVSLPERDMAELLTMVRRLLELDAFLRPSSPSPSLDVATTTAATAAESPPSPQSPQDAWRRMSQLRLLKEVPQRAALARRSMEALVQSDVVECLSGDLWESETWPRTTRAIEAAALLGVLEASLFAFQSKLVHAQWSAAQESVVSSLMSSNTLDDTAADELLSRSTSSSERPEPTTEDKKAVLAYTSDCRFSAFMGVFSDVVDVLTESVSRTAQSWGLVITECFPKAVAAYSADSSTALIRKATRGLLGAVCTHAESVVALLVDVRCGSKVVTNVTEIEDIARRAFAFLHQVTGPVRELSSITGLHLPDITSAENGDAIRLGKHIQAAVHRLAKRHLKTQHARQMEKLHMVVESETWSPKEDIDPVFQTHVECLCKADAGTVAAFDAKCVETEQPLSLAAGELGGAGVGGPSGRGKGASPSRPGGGHGGSGETDADLMNAKSSKLYLSLDGEGDGRVVSNSLLILVELLSDYVDYLGKFPSLAFDVVSKVYELLALYDSLCASMVLGAQAMEKGTLHSITTTHLCVASQCSAFLADFIPQLQQHFLAVLRVNATPAGAETQTAPLATGYVSTSTRKLLPFITNDFGRVGKDCSSHRNEFFHKMASLVLLKVDSLGAVEANGEWTARGNEWVMTMLREVARLIRTLRPLLPSTDLNGVVVPLLGSLAAKIRQVTRSVPESATDARNTATSDILLFKLNVERFGFDVLRCAAITSVSAAMSAEDLAPAASDEDALAWFFAQPAQPPPQQQWATAKRA